MSPTPRREPLKAPPRFTPLVDGEVLAPAPPPLPPRVWDDPEPETATDGAPDPGPLPLAKHGPVVQTEPLEPRPRSRSTLLGLAVGLAVAVAGIGIAFSVIAIPLFALASIDPGSGLDRDVVRKGLLYVALPFGGISGVVIGLVVGIWYGRGGRLPRDDRAIHKR